MRYACNLSIDKLYFQSRVWFFRLPCTSLITLANNNLIYIDRDAFQFCFSLQNLALGKNSRLQELPPSFGPNTANMLNLFLACLNLQSLPGEFFAQFESLNRLSIRKWGINGALDNDVLNGLPNLSIFITGCCSSIPNMTGHLPRLEELVIAGLPEDRIPEENMYGLHMLRVIIQTPCLYVPVFEGAARLESIDASQCEVTELPDLSQHRALKEVKVNTAHFQCNSKCCWMSYEDISAEGLDWIPAITCNGPPNLGGYQIANITTLQARCFESKSIHWKYVCISNNKPLSAKSNHLITLPALRADDPSRLGQRGGSLWVVGSLFRQKIPLFYLCHLAVHSRGPHGSGQYRVMSWSSWLIEHYM